LLWVYFDLWFVVDLLEFSLMLVDFPVEWRSVGYGYLVDWFMMNFWYVFLGLVRPIRPNGSRLISWVGCVARSFGWCFPPLLLFGCGWSLAVFSVVDLAVCGWFCLSWIWWCRSRVDYGLCVFLVSFFPLSRPCFQCVVMFSQMVLVNKWW